MGVLSILAKVHKINGCPEYSPKFDVIPKFDLWMSRSFAEVLMGVLSILLEKFLC